MTPSDSSPKLPLWIFFLTDAVLIAAAAFIFHDSPRPLSTTAILSIVTCVLGGALVLFVPLVLHYERQKNEQLDDRQRALEALARTIGTSAEQISIAASGFHQIAELAQKNLRQAEQLPHKLQDKIAEFQAQLANANDTEKEELEKELIELRSADSERLQTIADKVAKTVAELTKLEASAQSHLTAANDAMAKLSFGAAGAVGKAQAAAEQAFAQARTEAARGLGETAGNAARSVETAKTAALAEIDVKLAQAAEAFVARVARELAGKTLAASPSAEVSSSTPSTPTSSSVPAAESNSEPPPKAEGTAHPPKRPRKPRREEPTADDASPTAANSESTSSQPATAAAEPAAAAPSTEPTAPKAEEPPPVAAEKIAEVAPVAPHSAQPFPPASAPVSEAPTTTPEPSADPVAEPAVKAPRKRAAKKPEPEVEPGLGLELDDSPAPTGGNGERVLTSDGATRLVVTAYIGIGNRLFIRGTGPGLTWDKGVPLQFVSIGKWRWETNEATAPVEFKLYKNDELECAALGAQTLDPGYQQEVTAGF
jgi:hypothetical protein